MKAIVITEECHGDIKTCADMRSAFEYLLIAEWLPRNENKSMLENINDLMEKYKKNPNFLDGRFYFHEINIDIHKLNAIIAL